MSRIMKFASLLFIQCISFHGVYLQWPSNYPLCFASTNIDATAGKSTFTTADSSIHPSGGLINLGNTCYLNAQLQCAFHIPYVRDLILNEAHRSSGSRGLQSLGHIFHLMKTASIQGHGQIDRISSVSTAVLCRHLGINVYEQQDSQEFWKLLLPELKLSSLTNLYEGAYETYIAPLDASGREKKRQESFLDLSLDISRNKSTLDSLEDMFCRAELLSVREGNGWRPDKNSEKVDALKGNSLHVAGLPKILQLHLLRFHFDWNTERMSKIHDSFEFPIDLDLSCLCKDVAIEEKEAAVYTLHSIIIHSGEFGSGHYYSYIRPDVTKNEWYRYDDDRVTPVSFAQVQEDSFGGSCALDTRNQKKGWGQWLFHHGLSFGVKQNSNSAYVLQYVKKIEIPLLWGEYK